MPGSLKNLISSANLEFLRIEYSKTLQGKFVLNSVPIQILIMSLHVLDDSWVDPNKPEFLVPNIENTLKCDHIFMTIKNVKSISINEFFGIPKWINIDYEIEIELRKTYCVLCQMQNTMFTILP